MFRKLLYHRGIDDEVATYTTDYVAGFLSLFLGILYVIIILHTKIKASIACSSEKKKGSHYEAGFQTIKSFVNNKLQVRKYDSQVLESCLNKIATAGTFLCYSLMLLCGGYAHQNLQELKGISSISFHELAETEFNDAKQIRDLVSDRFTTREKMFLLYTLWQMANFFVGCLGSFYLTLFSCSLKELHKTIRFSKFFQNRINFFTKPFLFLGLLGGLVSLVLCISKITSFKKSMDLDKVALKRFDETIADFYNYSASKNIDQAFVTKNPKQKMSNLNLTLELLLQLENETGSNSLYKELNEYTSVNFNKIWNSTALSVFFMLSITTYAILTSIGSVKLKRLFDSSHFEQVCYDYAVNNAAQNIDETNPDETEEVKSLQPSAFSRLSESSKTNELPTNFDQYCDHDATNKTFIYPSATTTNWKPQLPKYYFRQWALCCVGTWIIFLSGLLQLALASVCSKENAFQTRGCPLPNSFNHNALFHILLAMGISVIFLGKVLAHVKDCCSHT